jgi:hypothetical protein
LLPPLVLGDSVDCLGQLHAFLPRVHHTLRFDEPHFRDLRCKRASLVATQTYCSNTK